jgi:hypothetical protein
MKSPLVTFSYVYFIRGAAMIALCWYFVAPAIARFLGVNWIAVGIAMASITFGALYKDTSDLARFVYLMGLAWLALVFVVGIVLIWNDGIGAPELVLLLE